MKINETDIFRLKDGYIVKFKQTAHLPTYKFKVVEVNGQADDLFGERFTEDGHAYHFGCGYEVIENLSQ